jgi:hypothetical protein
LAGKGRDGVMCVMDRTGGVMVMHGMEFGEVAWYDRIDSDFFLLRCGFFSSMFAVHSI